MSIDQARPHAARKSPLLNPLMRISNGRPRNGVYIAAEEDEQARMLPRAPQAPLPFPRPYTERIIKTGGNQHVQYLG